MIDFIKNKVKVSSLKVKFTALVVVIGSFSFGIAAYLSTEWLAEEIEQDYKEKAALIGAHIIHDLEDSMQGAHDEILSTLDFYRKYKDIEELQVFNTKGKEMLTRGQGNAGGAVEEVLRKGEPLYFHKNLNQKEVLTFVIPIKNKTEEKGEPFAGALLLSFNESQIEHYIGQQKRRLFALFGLIATGIIVATLVAVNRLFLRRLALIQEGTEALRKGEFQHQIPGQSKDEIGRLVENFNSMARGLEEKERLLFEQVMLVSQSQKEWQETFDSITDLASVVDTNCNVIRANKAYRGYFSISPCSAISLKCDHLFGKCLLSNCPNKRASNDVKPTTGEFHHEQSGRVLKVSLFPCFSSEGNLSSSVLIAKDITEEKENEARLIMNERLAALGQMASGIAHEINNPLATIAICAEGLFKRIKKGQLDLSYIQSHLETISEEVQRCEEITKSMLSFVRKVDSDRRWEADINSILDNALEMLRFQDRLKHTVVLRNYQEIPPIITKDGELRQVFLAVIVNAIDAMEGRGTLTLATCADGGDKISITISDTGPGIPSHFISRIFEPFFTTKSQKGGTGLGLAIAQKIIKENNGRIEVDSKEGSGTTFQITLPV